MLAYISDMVEELMEEIAYQETPTEIEYDEYERMIYKAIRRLYVDTDRDEAYSDSLFVEGDEGTMLINELRADEWEYIMCLAKKAFFKKVQTSVNEMVSYSTDALTVTQGDKPYANLKNTIDDLERERIELYHRMHRFSLGQG